MPQVSVVVPACDASRDLPGLLGSLALSTFDDFEVVVVDDGSGDTTGDVARAASDGLPSVTVVRHDSPLGPGASRNSGVAAARGRFVAFVDADDRVSPDYLGRLAAAARTTGASWVRTDHVEVRDGTRTPRPVPGAPVGEVLVAREQVLPLGRATMIDYPYSWAGLIDRDQVDGATTEFVPSLRTAEDRDWIWRMHLGAPTVVVEPIGGYFYHRGGVGSLTTVGDERQLDFFDALDASLEVVRADREADLFLPKALNIYCQVLLSQYARQRRLTPDVRARLHSRGRETYEAWPAAERRQAVGAMRLRAQVALRLMVRR